MTETTVIKGKGADRRLVMDPPSPDYRQLGWRCIYHEQAGRSCHNPLDCDLVPTWTLTVDAAKRLLSEGNRRPYREPWEWRKANGGFTIRTDGAGERLFHAYDLNNNAACDPRLGLAASSEELTPQSRRCVRCEAIVKYDPMGRPKRSNA